MKNSRSAEVLEFDEGEAPEDDKSLTSFPADKSWKKKRLWGRKRLIYAYKMKLMDVQGAFRM